MPRHGAFASSYVGQLSPPSDTQRIHGIDRDNDTSTADLSLASILREQTGPERKRLEERVEGCNRCHSDKSCCTPSANSSDARQNGGNPCLVVPHGSRSLQKGGLRTKHRYRMRCDGCACYLLLVVVVHPKKIEAEAMRFYSNHSCCVFTSAIMHTLAVVGAVMLGRTQARRPVIILFLPQALLLLRLFIPQVVRRDDLGDVVLHFSEEAEKPTVGFMPQLIQLLGVVEVRLDFVLDLPPIVDGDELVEAQMVRPKPETPKDK